MKKIYAFYLLFLLSASARSQTIFWIEEFNNGCSSLCTSYSGPNGAWTFASNGPTTACGGATTPNIWYISCAENGNAVGSCGTGCGNNATLHVGNDPNSPSAGIFCPSGDCGAAYDAGGYCDILATPPSTITDILASSPSIDCSGRTNITLTFNYIERGQGTNDNATVMYYDGVAWTLLADMAKTPNTCGAGQGKWTAYSIALPVSADNNPNVGIAFHWVNDDDGTGNDPSFAVDSVRLTVPSAGLPPVAAFTQGTTAGCDSLCVTYTDGSTGGATSWSWSFPGGTPSTSNLQSPTVCYTTPGTFDVTQIVTNAFGSDTLIKQALVTITPTPVPDFTSTAQNLCVGDCIDYSDLSSGNIQSYIWTFQGGTPLNSSDQNPVNVCYNIAGQFNTTLTVTNGACANSNTHVGYIIVNQPAAPVISVSGDTLLSTPALTYQWYNVATGAIPAGIFQYYVAAPGSYYVCITDAFGCSACSDTITYSPEAVSNATVNRTFGLFPNPASDKLLIHGVNLEGSYQLRITDVAGRKVKEVPIHFSNQTSSVSVKDFAKGPYIALLIDENNRIIFSAPFVKE